MSSSKWWGVLAVCGAAFPAAADLSPQALCDSKYGTVDRCVQLLREASTTDDPERAEALRQQASAVWKRHVAEVEALIRDGRRRHFGKRFVRVGAKFQSLAQQQLDGMVEQGRVGEVEYRFEADGYGVVAGWQIACAQDRMTDERSCVVASGDLFVDVRAAGPVALQIGERHFPGALVALRLDASKAETTKAPGWGQPAAARMVERMTNSQNIATRFMAFPNRVWRDREVAAQGLAVAVKLAQWACANAPGGNP